MKKRIVSLFLAGSLLIASQSASAVSSKTVSVGGKNVTVNSTISRTGASGHTGSDGTIKARVVSNYSYAVNGSIKGPLTKDSGSVYGVASVGFSAPGNSISASITSSHTVSYGGDKSKATTSVSY